MQETVTLLTSLAALVKSTPEEIWPHFFEEEYIGPDLFANSLKLDDLLQIADKIGDTHLNVAWDSSQGVMRRGINCNFIVFGAGIFTYFTPVDADKNFVKARISSVVNVLKLAKNSQGDLKVC
jgi:hypothetical protein